MSKSLLLILLLLSFSNAKLLLLHLNISQKPNQSAIEQIQRLQKLANIHNLKIEFKGVPWKRGLIMIEKGLADGMLGCSYTQDRARYAVFPMRNGKLDQSRRMSNGKTYYIYKNKNSTLSWNGKSFSSPDGIVAAKEGYAVLSDLQKHKNIDVIEIPSVNVAIRYLIYGKIAAYAGLDTEVDIFQKNDEFQKNVVKEPIPIRKKPYFIMFSKISYNRKKDEIERFWDMLKEQ